MKDRRHLEHRAQGAAMDRRQERVADQLVVEAHAGQQFAGAVLGRDLHPARVGDRVGEQTDLALLARLGEALHQAAAHFRNSLAMTGRVTLPLVPSMKVPAAAAIGFLGSPWWAKARVKATERVMR